MFIFLDWTRVYIDDSFYNHDRLCRLIKFQLRKGKLFLYALFPFALLLALFAHIMHTLVHPFSSTSNILSILPSKKTRGKKKCCGSGEKGNLEFKVRWIIWNWNQLCYFVSCMGVDGGSQLPPITHVKYLTAKPSNVIMMVQCWRGIHHGNQINSKCSRRCSKLQARHKISGYEMQMLKGLRDTRAQTPQEVRDILC